MSDTIDEILARIHAFKHFRDLHPDKSYTSPEGADAIALAAELDRLNAQTLELVREIERLRGDLTVARMDLANAEMRERHAKSERDELRGLLRNVLDAGEVEAKAEAEMRNAQRNYTNPRPYVDAWERAMVVASNAEKEARAALSAADQPKRHALDCTYWDGLMAQVCSCGIGATPDRENEAHG